MMPIAQRDAHLADLDTGRAIVHIADTAHRVRQSRDLAQALDHAVDTGRGQFQTVEHGGIQALVTTSLHILLVGLDQRFAATVDRLGHSQQRTVLASGVGTRNLTGRGTGLLTQFGHIFCYIHLIYPLR